MIKDEKIVQAGFRSSTGVVQGTGAFHDVEALPSDFQVKEEGFIAEDGSFMTRDEATAALNMDHPVQSEELELSKALNDYSFEGPTLNGSLYEIKAKTKEGKVAGSLTYRASAVSDPNHKHLGYHRVDQAHVGLQHQRQGLYGRMLQLGSLHVKQKLQSKGLVSEGQWRSEAASGAWERLAQKKRVQKLPGLEPDAPDFRMAEKPFDLSDPNKQDYEFARAFSAWMLLRRRKIAKSEGVYGPLHSNLEGWATNADHEVAGQMSGYDPESTPEFKAARFMAGGRASTQGELRAALIAYDHDFEMAALLAYSLPRTEENRTLLRIVARMPSFGKSEPEPTTIPRVIAPAIPDAEKTSEAVRRAYEAGSVKTVKLKGKHSGGTVIAVDPKKKDKFLIKPGSGPTSPAAGVDEDGATQSQREVCFSQVAEEIGLGDSVPKAALLLIDGNDTAALELLGSDYKNLNERRKLPGFDVKKIFEPYLADGTLYRWAALDLILGNIDRHAGNVMVDTDGDVKLIDHGSAFAGFAFNPALDDRAFIPCYLRAWSNENFSALSSTERLRKMPLPSKHANDVFSQWIDGISVPHIQSILHKYGILTDPTVSRLQAIKALPSDERLLWVLSFWAGKFGS